MIGCRRFSGSTRPNSEKGRELDRCLREYCATRTALEVETALNVAKIGCARVFNTRDQHHDEHYAAREMTCRCSTGNRGCRSGSIGEDTTDILGRMLGLSEPDIAELYAREVVHRTAPFTTPQVDAINP
jgi:crotonobetainyl-CoA:carnitine CoA-transferase CaiB-like acyl-CoA transferase